MNQAILTVARFRRQPSRNLAPVAGRLALVIPAPSFLMGWPWGKIGLIAGIIIVIGIGVVIWLVKASNTSGDNWE